MGQKVTLGGQRLGAGGERIQQEAVNYNRSTHDLSESIVTSMACGVLTPFLVKPMLRGDVFEIDTDAAARTIPTKGPLFGSYKLQGDFFFCPIRLYQALMHNNPVEIAMQMDKVMLPTITIATSRGENEHKTLYGGFNLSSLMKYTGMSGIGRAVNENTQTMSRTMQCVPQLAYYDIYKNYYANKQEESGKVIGIKNKEAETIQIQEISGGVFETETDTTGSTITFPKWNEEFSTYGMSIHLFTDTKEEAENLLNANIEINTEISDYVDTIHNIIKQNGNMTYDVLYSNVKEKWYFKWDLGNTQPRYEKGTINSIIIPLIATIKESTSGLEILDFPLKNIDDMRWALLTHHQLGVPFKVGLGSTQWSQNSGDSGDGLPYSTLFQTDYEGKTANKYPMNGLCLKTYQNDIYNIWLNSELIDGENGVNAKAKVAVTDGSFSINSLLYAQKLFNLYNRIAASDGTYDGWLNLVYEKEDRISHEKPLYLGGFYNEIVFEEIVQTAPAGGDPLGELGGKGRLAEKTKGGKIIVKADEIGFLIGIASITPRIYYTQQNEFFMTDIFSMDDFHKPELDQIGFQDLIGERLMYADTALSNTGVVHRSKIGKLPAWLEYQTSVDKAYGDLAEPNGNGYMILNRNYEADENGIVDATTYIDPTKYNYAFAYQALDAQNFWVQVRIKNITRSLMSANLIPNI